MSKFVGFAHPGVQSHGASNGRPNGVEIKGDRGATVPAMARVVRVTLPSRSLFSFPLYTGTAAVVSFNCASRALTVDSCAELLDKGGGDISPNAEMGI